MDTTHVAVADLHGHRALLDGLVKHLDQELGAGYVLVALGDYVDNGPEIPGLLERLIALKEERGDRFVPILGNHDLACLRTLGRDGGLANEAWYRCWQHYWNHGLSTPAAYGARSAAELVRAMPAAHRAFLQALPWYHEAGGHVFVHAGLEAGPVAPQLAMLARREPLPGTWTHAQLRDKKLATVSDPAWGCVVVSGHTARPAPVPSAEAPHFVTPHRVTLSSSVDSTGELWAVALPGRVFYKVQAGAGVWRGTIPGAPG